jgi:hypothetical protein
MNDRPTAAELIAAARHCLERELLPAVTDARLRYQGLVAANVLAIVERELAVAEDHLTREWEWLAEVLGWLDPLPPSTTALTAAVREGNVRLCERIRNGDFDAPERFRELASQLRQGVEGKLQVANPRYLAAFSLAGEGVKTKP